MRCNGAPNANNPSDLRKYLHMWNETMEEYNYKERNWLLKTNEETLLTHDANIINLSKEYLRQQQENLGDIYAQRIKDVLSVCICTKILQKFYNKSNYFLQILSELDETLEDKNISESIISDLLELRLKFRLSLNDFINDFTYKILSHIERDMESSSDISGMSEHNYKSDVFKSQIWAILSDIQV